MHFVTYETAETLCVQLARMIQSQLGAQVAFSRFVAIPRGGLIVLGMLSYCLGLKAEQLRGSASAPGQLVVVVDDCSLSGKRFAGVLKGLPEQRVIFAHLYSHPDLRRAILAAEPRVQAVLAAQDLPERQDLTPETRQKALEIGRGHAGGKSYWVGLTEHLAFAWGEPDLSIWNGRTQDFEAWHAVSPRRCLEGRIELGFPVVEAAAGALDLAENVCWRKEGEQVLLWQQKGDRVYGLQGVSAAMWAALLAFGEQERAADYLAGQFAVERARLLSDLHGFSQSLLEKGLLAWLA